MHICYFQNFPFLGSLSLHLHFNHLIAWRMRISFRHWNFFCQIWTQDTLWHLLGLFLVNFEICQQWRIQDFPEGGRQPIICPIFPENCMKIKKFWAQGGAGVPGAPPPPRSANGQFLATAGLFENFCQNWVSSVLKSIFSGWRSDKSSMNLGFRWAGQ